MNQSREDQPKLETNLTSLAAETQEEVKEDAKQYNATLMHNFIEHCYLIHDLSPIFYWCSVMLLGVAVVWTAIVFVFRKRQSQQLQKLLTSIPFLLLIYNFIYGKFYTSCPWTELTISSYAYLRMGRVVTVTFTFTFLHSLIYLICRGWKTTMMTVERNQATNITMVGSMFYLLYSAYFLSSDYS